MKYILTAIALLLCLQADAQFFKKILDKAEQSVNDKIDKKIDEGVDKAVDAPEKEMAKKKEKKAGQGSKTETASSTESTGGSPHPTPARADMSMEGEGTQTVIQTNITCEAGKKKVEAALKKEDGVFEVKVNIKNGEVAIRYSSDGTSYSSLLETINMQGFDADGDKPGAGAPANPCKKGKN